MTKLTVAQTGTLSFEENETPDPLRYFTETVSLLPLLMGELFLAVEPKWGSSARGVSERNWVQVETSSYSRTEDFSSYGDNG